MGRSNIKSVDIDDIDISADIRLHPHRHHRLGH